MPEFGALLDTHGVVCWHLKRYDEAEASLKEALRVYRKDGLAAPSSVVSRFHLSDVYWESGRAEEASRSYQECLDLQEKIGGLNPSQTAQVKRRLLVLSSTSEQPKNP